MDDLIQEIKNTLRGMTGAARELIRIAPDLARGAPELLGLPNEELEEGIDKFAESLPEEKKELMLSMFLGMLLQAKEEVEHTQERVSGRVQPEGLERKKPEFQSFKKRKGDWSW